MMLPGLLLLGLSRAQLRQRDVDWLVMVKDVEKRFRRLRRRVRKVEWREHWEIILSERMQRRCRGVVLISSGVCCHGKKCTTAILLCKVLANVKMQLCVDNFVRIPGGIDAARPRFTF